MKPMGKMRQPEPIASDNNVMPSMVVRQQRIQMGANGNSVQGVTRRTPVGSQPGEESSQGTPSPPPPPTFSIIKAAKEMSGRAQQQQQFDQDGLVLPKRVLRHPVSVAQPIIRDLNRELKFNQVRGKNVLDQKSELKKALEKLEDSKRKREAEQERLSRRSSLELRLEERAERIAKQAVPLQHQVKTKAPEMSSAESSSSSSSAAVAAAAVAHFPPSATAPAAAACKPLSNFTIRSITR